MSNESGDTEDIGFKTQPDPVDRGPSAELRQWVDDYMKPALLAMDGMPRIVEHMLAQFILDQEGQTDLLLLWSADRATYMKLLQQCFEHEKGKATDAMGRSKSSKQETTPEAAQDPEPSGT